MWYCVVKIKKEELVYVKFKISDLFWESPLQFDGKIYDEKKSKKDL